MFSSLKFSTLRPRAQNKGQQDDNINPRNEYDDNDGADADISCTSSLRCQQPFTKCKFLEYTYSYNIFVSKIYSDQH